MSAATHAGATIAPRPPEAAELDPRSPLTGVRGVVAGWAASRVVLLLAALVVALKKHWGLTGLVMHWDALWYNRIALDGYTTTQARAFFPGWPMVLRAGQALGIPIAWTGVTVATVCSLGAALALYRIGGRRYGLWAALAWCFAPMTVFTSVVYTESLFCLVGFWAWERMLRGRWAQMAVLLALGCAVRITGVFLVIGVFVWILTRRLPSEVGAAAAPGNATEPLTAQPMPASMDGDPVAFPTHDEPALARLWRRVAPTLWLALPTALVLVYAAYLHAISGDWMLWYNAQLQGWDRGLTWPWQTVYKTLLYVGPLRDQTQLGFSAIHVAEIISWLIGGAVTVWCLLKRRWGEAAFVAIQFVGLGTADHLISVNRALLVWFPSWLIYGAWLARRAPRTRWIILAATSLVVFAWAFLCFRGYWCS